MLKRVLEREGPYELDINKIFSKEPLASDPRNHCAPLLDVVELPNDPPIMVHAFLRSFYKPRFQTYGEFVAFFGQISEVGITSFTLGSIVCSATPGYPIYASEPRRASVTFLPLILYGPLILAIRDCTSENIMLDPSRMYPNSFHPSDINRNRNFRGKAKRYTRTWRPPLYLLIDVGLARQYDPANGPPLEMPLRGGDKSAPEHQDRQIPCDPFPTDVYYLGNLVREKFLEVRTFVY
jgi:hypothetical protein